MLTVYELLSDFASMRYSVAMDSSMKNKSPLQRIELARAREMAKRKRTFAVKVVVELVTRRITHRVIIG
jgi:hypothetical protein